MKNLKRLQRRRSYRLRLRKFKKLNAWRYLPFPRCSIDRSGGVFRFVVRPPTEEELAKDIREADQYIRRVEGGRSMGYRDLPYDYARRIQRERDERRLLYSEYPDFKIKL